MRKPALTIEEQLMDAVVFDHDREIRLLRRPMPRPSPTGVLLRPAYIGICGTDLHAATLDHFRPGVVMGHEFAGRITATGGEASRFTEGDLVVVNPNGNLCGTCAACRAGHTNLCSAAVFEHGIGIHEDGGMAEFVAVDERVLFAVPEGVTERQAAWVEPLATAVRAVRNSEHTPSASALVVGAGPIGLLVIQVLRCLGVASIGVVEPSLERRKVAMRVGADHALTPDEVGVAFSNQRADVGFECSGSTGGFESVLANVRSGGTVIVVGLAPMPLTIEPFELVGRELTLRGSIIYDDLDFQESLELLKTGRVDVDQLTTAVMPLKSHAEAFRLLHETQEAIKILLRP